MMADVLDFNDAPTFQVIDPKAYEERLQRLRQELAGRAAELVRDLFPLARHHNGEARIGNIDGEPGESLSIGLSGDRAGLWFDHATNDGGDLIDLWQRTSNATDFLRVVEELERWCGIVAAPRWTTRVAKVAEQRRQAAAERPQEPAMSFSEPSGVWAYTTPDGALLATVKRYDTPDGKKTYRPFLPSGAAGMPDPRPLYRQADIAAADRVILVEGEKCADALASAGIAATTQMGGASANPAKTDWGPLAGKHVVIWPDNDEPGLAMPAKVRPAIEAVAASVRVLSPPAGKPPKWDAADAVAEGLDLSAILAPPSERPRIPIYSRRQLRELKPPAWLVDEVFAEASVVSLYGPSGSLKSFVAIGLSMSVATGLPWHGREVRQGPVVYVTGEGRDQIGNRLDAWEIANNYEGDADIFIVPLGVAISDPEWVGHLISTIEGVCAAGPVMIWLDTLARTFGAGDENSQKDMNAFIAGMDRLRDRFRCVVGVVHHTGKEDARGLRGSSALYAAMDTVIRTDRAAGKMVVTLKNAQPHGKQKDAAEFGDIALEAKVIKLKAVDAKGRDLTSLALAQTEAQAEERDDTPPAEPGRPQGQNQAAILAALKRAKGQPLGRTSLTGMLGKPSISVQRSVDQLLEKGLIKASGNGWVLA